MSDWPPEQCPSKHLREFLGGRDSLALDGVKCLLLLRLLELIVLSEQRREVEDVDALTVCHDDQVIVTLAELV